MAVFLLRGVVRLLLLTCHIEVRGLHRFITLACQERCILMAWHNRLFLMPAILSRYASSLHYSAFVSHSRDGQRLATLIHSYPIADVITVPHNSRHTALKEVIYRLEYLRHIILITPDGPRGPRYKVKPGIALAAKVAQAYVLPFSWAANRFWQLSNWDKMIIPKPFAHILIEFGRPHFLPQGTDLSTEQQAQELESLLHFSGKALYEELLPDSTRWPK